MYFMKFTNLLNQTTRPRSFASVFMGVIFSLLSYTQSSAQLTVAVVKTDPTCANFTNGTATATASGGTAPYSYSWSNGVNGNALTGLSPGTYTVTATAANNATAVGSVTIVAATPLNMTFSFASICTGGAVTASATGGTGPYTYNWPGGRVGATQSGLAAGGYNITLTDSKGCSIQRFVNVPAPFTAGLRIGELVCFGDCDAAIDALPQGGTGPFTYLWNTGARTSAIIGIPSGTYSVTITDANGCTSSSTGTVANPPVVTLTTTTVAPGCTVGSTGSATVSATGGRPPFTYRWSNGQIGATATGLVVGTYFVTATDSKGCNKTASVVLTSVANFTLGVAQTNATCGGTNGTATANIIGGTPPFRYLWSTGATTQGITNLGAGSYTVTASDNSGCSASFTVNINAVGSLTITLTGTNAACGIANGTATATPTSGTAPFRYLWSNGATTQTISLLSAGTYNVTVTDASGCTATGQKSITQTSSFDVNLDARNVVCNGGTDGQISAMVSGGSAPYVYAWSNGGNAAVIANLGIGTYTVTVTDANSCTALKSVTITQPTAVTASIAATATSCGVANGAATVSAAGGTPGYTYLWTTGSTSASVTGLGAGSYNVSVTDSKGCRTVATTTISASTNLDASGAITTIKCSGQNTGAISLTVTGATGTVTYAWSTGATTPSVSNLTAGNYSVTINDSRNCSVVKQFTLAQPSAVVASVSGTMATCGSSNGSATASATGGTAPYTFKWNTGATTAALSGLSAGTYLVTATDANLCTSTSSITITTSTGLTLTVTPTAIRCNGESNGSATATVTGGTAPYTYIWNTGATSATITGLSALTYQVTVNDAAGCSAAQVVTITQPTAIATFATTIDAVCTNNTGRITNTISGGTPPYTYLWSNGATTLSLTNLASGTYTLTVTDSRGCVKIVPAITINFFAAPTVTLTPTNAACSGGNTGAVASAVTGGTAPFTYAWSNGSTSASLSAVAAGTYTVTVTDSRSCSTVATSTVGQAVNFTLALTSTNIACGGGNTGSVTATVTGGTAPFTYAWSNGGTTASISGLAAATYTVTVTDSRGCSNIASRAVTQAANLSITLASTNARCNGGNTGTATATVTGGTAPYTYLWNNGATSASISGLIAGAYQVTVTDASGCSSVSTSVTVGQPSAIVITLNSTDASCSATGAILNTSSVTGGTAPYTYLWSNGATTLALANLSGGIYTLTVTDANGCTNTASKTINSATAPTVTLTATNIACNGGSTGAVSAAVTGGTAPFTYSWSNGGTTASISGLAVGTYTVTVTDSRNCTATASRTLTQATVLSVSLTSTNVRCNGGSTGSITAAVTGGTAPYTFNWSNGGNGTGLVAGTYRVTVTDAAGCSVVSSSVTITQPTSIAITLNSTDAACTANSGAILNTSSVTGGTAPYTYLWSNGATTLALSNLVAGTYTLTVTDANGCTNTASKAIAFFAAPTVTLNIVTPIFCNGGTGSISAVVAGGTAPFSYAWNNSATNSTLTGLLANTYSVTVTDSRGCTANRSVTLTQPTAIAITQLVTSATCLPVGRIVLTATGGTGALTYLWSANANNATTATISGLAGGSYTVTVTDANSCRNTATIVVPSIISPNFSCSVAQTVAISLNGVADGQARVTTTNGVAPFTYRWTNGGSVQTTQTAVNLVAGLASVTVTDANGCTTTCSLTLTEPACVQIVDPGTITGDQSYCEASELTGIFEATPATGGTGAIEYLWMYSDFTADFSVGGWNTIPGATGKDLPANLLPTITRKTNFIRCVRRAGCGLYKEGNVIMKVPKVTSTFTYEPSPCLGRPTTLTAFDNGAGTFYQWIIQGSDITSSLNRVVTVTFTSTGAKTVNLVVSKNGCTLTRTVTVNVANCVSGFGSIFAFSASTTSGNAVHLNWATTDEKQSSKYMVEKSTDNVNFTLIGTVASQNLPNNLYTFVDPKPKMGRAFYRIHQMTLTNDDITMSKTAKVMVADKGQTLVTYPNPVGSTLFVEVVDADNTEGSIEIYNQVGALVKVQKFTSNQMRYEVETNDLGKGIYILKIRRTDGTIATTKITKL